MKKKVGRYRFIQGEFVVRHPDLPHAGPQPDGDTIAFRPANPAEVAGMPLYGGRPASFARHGTVSVRFLDIDALETHFQGTRQNLEFANAARDRMLGLLGFEGVKFFPQQPNRILEANADAMPGFVLALGTDIHGRVLADVFADGATPPCILDRRSGDPVYVDTKDLDQSVNKALVDEGLAYAELYSTTPIQNARYMSTAAKTAREFQKGMWPHETASPRAWATIPDIAALERLVLFPKLFRRLAAFFTEGRGSLDSFDAWLRGDPRNRDDRVLLPTGELGNFHDIVESQGARIRMLCNPEDVSFLPDHA